MDESMFGWDGGLGIELDAEGPLELEFGSLVAALSAWTEDETELELQLRALVECGRYRIAVGCDPAPAAGRGHAARAADALAASFEIDGLTRS